MLYSPCALTRCNKWKIKKFYTKLLRKSRRTLTVKIDRNIGIERLKIRISCSLSSRFTVNRIQMADTFVDNKIKCRAFNLAECDSTKSASARNIDEFRRNICGSIEVGIPSL